jgi:hypothetical protein
MVNDSLTLPALLHLVPRQATFALSGSLRGTSRVSHVVRQRSAVGHLKRWLAPPEALVVLRATLKSLLASERPLLADLRCNSVG